MTGIIDKVTNEQIVVHLQYLREKIDELSEKLDATPSRVEFDLLKGEVRSLKSRSWINNTLSAIVGSILTFLLLYFLNGIIK